MIVAASRLELARYDRQEVADRLREEGIDLHVEYLYTGVGVASCALAMAGVQPDQFDVAINIGFAGAVDRAREIGETVVVMHDRFLDYGIIRNGSLVPLHETDLLQLVPPDKDGRFMATVPANLPARLSNWAKVDGYTVSHPTEGDASLLRLVSLPPGHVETMEGAAFAMACQHIGLAPVSLRIISNYVAPPGQNQWNQRLAQERLAETLLAAIMSF